MLGDDDDDDDDLHLKILPVYTIHSVSILHAVNGNTRRNLDFISDS